MKSRRPQTRTLAALVAAFTALPAGAALAAPPNAQDTIYGIRLRLGARHDDVRMCVATPPGVKGGFAMDVSLFSEIPLGESTSLDVNLPFVRPLLFAAAFRMLQFEPEVTFLYRGRASDGVTVVGGPSLGLSLHYGPDYRSSPTERGPSFFAFGPRLGAYVGVELERDSGFDFGLGVHPYATDLFGAGDAPIPRGKVFGAMLDGSFRFGRSR